MMDKTALLFMLDTRKAVDASRGKQPTSVGGRGQLSSSVGNPEERSPNRGGGGRVPCAFATWLATQEDIENTLGDQRPPCKPPSLPQSYASDLKVPRSHKEAMGSEYAHLWEESTGPEFYGLLDAGTFLIPYGNQCTTTSTQCECLTGRLMSTFRPHKVRRDLQHGRMSREQTLISGDFLRLLLLFRVSGC